MTPRHAARLLRAEGLDATGHRDGRLTLGVARHEPADWLVYLRRRLAAIPGAVEAGWRTWQSGGLYRYSLTARIG